MPCWLPARTFTCTTVGSTFAMTEVRSVGVVADSGLAEVDVLAAALPPESCAPTRAPTVPPSAPATSVAAAATATVPRRIRGGRFGGSGGGAAIGGVQCGCWKYGLGWGVRG